MHKSELEEDPFTYSLSEDTEVTNHHSFRVTPSTQINDELDLELMGGN